MVLSCWIRGCVNRADGNRKLSFFSIPKIREKEGDYTRNLSDERRRLWLANISRKDEPTQYSKICSDHFVAGRPASMYDRANPDWAPTLKLGEPLQTPTKSQKKQTKVESNCKRLQRVLKRGETREKHHVARALLDLQSDTLESHEPLFTAVPLVCESLVNSTKSSEDSEPPESPTVPVTQSQVDSEIQRLISENMQLRSEMQSYKLTQDSFENNDDKVKYYTGLPNFETLILLLNIVTPFISTKNMRLGVFERLLMTLMRLKLNLPVRDLAFRFNISTSTVSRIFLVIIHILYVRLKHLIYWPEREELQKTMPMEFRTYFSKRLL